MDDHRPTDIGEAKGARFHRDGGRIIYSVQAGRVRMVIVPDDGGSLGASLTPDQADGHADTLREMAKIARGGSA